MSYVQNNLLTGEEIVYATRIHWSIYLASIILAPFMIMTVVPILIIPFVVDNVGKEASSMIGAMSIFWVIYFFVWCSAYVARNCTELAVTNRRLIAKSGIISRKTLELNLDKVESLSVNQGIIGRILNYGTITVNGTGGIKNAYRSIDNPLKFRRAVNEQLEVIKGGTPIHHHAPSPSQRDDIERLHRQLKELADMRSSGALTEDEFQAQKHRLMDAQSKELKAIV